jgi:hypothetical protein
MHDEQERTFNQIRREVQDAIRELTSIRHEIRTWRDNKSRVKRYLNQNRHHAGTQLHRTATMELTNICDEIRTLMDNRCRVVQYLRHARTQLHNILDSSSL